MVKLFYNNLQEAQKNAVTAFIDKITKKRDELLAATNEKKDSEKREQITKQAEEDIARVTGDLQKAMEKVAKETGLIPQGAVYEQAYLEAKDASGLLSVGKITDGTTVAVNSSFADMIKGRGMEALDVRMKTLNWFWPIFSFIMVVAGLVALIKAPWHIGFSIVWMGGWLIATIATLVTTIKKIPPFVPEKQEYNYLNLIDIAFSENGNKNGTMKITFPYLGDKGKEVIASMVATNKEMIALCQQEAINFDHVKIRDNERVPEKMATQAEQPVFNTIVSFGSYRNLTNLQNSIRVFLYGYPAMKDEVKYEFEYLKNQLTDSDSKKLLEQLSNCDKQFSMVQDEKVRNAFKLTEEVQLAYNELMYVLLRNMCNLGVINKILATHVDGTDQSDLYLDMKNGLVQHTKEKLNELNKAVVNYSFVQEEEMEKVIASIKTLQENALFAPPQEAIKKSKLVL